MHGLCLQSKRCRPGHAMCVVCARVCVCAAASGCLVVTFLVIFNLSCIETQMHSFFLEGGG